MVYSPKGKEKSLGPHFFDYLNGERSNATSVKCPKPNRFKSYLGTLNGEFKLTAQEIESLQNERDGYRLKVIYSISLPFFLRCYH